MHRLALVLAAAAFALTACNKADKRTPPPATEGKPADSGDLAKKVKKLEKRIAKIENVLKQAGVPLDEPDPDVAYAVPIGPNDPIEGPPTAKVTIVEAFEFA